MTAIRAATGLDATPQTWTVGDTLVSYHPGSRENMTSETLSYRRLLSRTAGPSGFMPVGRTHYITNPVKAVARLREWGIIG